MKLSIYRYDPDRDAKPYMARHNERQKQLVEQAFGKYK